MEDRRSNSHGQDSQFLPAGSQARSYVEGNVGPVSFVVTTLFIVSEVEVLEHS
jgi:hypothetical protein